MLLVPIWRCLLFFPIVDINPQITFCYIITKLLIPIAYVYINVRLNILSNRRPSCSGLLQVVSDWYSLSYPHSQHSAASFLFSSWLVLKNSSMELVWMPLLTILGSFIGTPQDHPQVQWIHRMDHRTQESCYTHVYGSWQ